MAPDSEQSTDLGHLAGGSTTGRLPTALRLRLAAGRFIKGSSAFGTDKVVALPFNKIAKLDVPTNEIDAMEFVRANTTIPIPQIVEVYKDPGGGTHFIMTRLPGTPLADAVRDMGPAQIETTASDFADYLGQLRRLVPPPSKDGTPVIGGASGGPGFDHRLGPRTWGPFSTVADFHTYIRFGQPLEDWDHEPAVMEIHGKPEGAYQLRFTHADLGPQNILVDPKNGKITGIIDWEFGGWYPEYWEYTKMHYGGVRPQWEKWFAQISKEDGIEKYEAERTAEEAIWSRAGPFGYV
ncbi:kinase-like domain-containing protein [Chaetomium fimeti]|uniref:Kinase-like domain-containing protein n=1 Tax=Chaetomium fimeti TaxID=1854472 RepID=A0AAE0HAK6_9PEZI|nr:kinase-like domain-containing protein [Chaetomium fimeti]